MKTVSFLGYHALVPASWQVVNLRSTPTACVRFDRHTVYLGAPGPAERCPAHLIAAKTEALLVEPLSGRDGASGIVADPIAHQYVVALPRAGIEVIATYGSNQALVKSILKSASATPGPASAGPSDNSSASPGGGVVRQLQAGVARAWQTSSPPAQAPPALWPAGQWLPTLPPSAPPSPPASAPPVVLPPSVTNGVGLGFDACTAPSAATMRAWINHSPYRAVGIYIGGSDRACAQPNLTAAWVSQQAAEGWHFIPLYVGPQAEWGQIKAALIQGASAADDAVTQAQALGFGPGTPLYYDMEAYPRHQNRAALRFLSAWSEELHIDGYASGVYSSSDSAVAGLANHYITYPDYSGYSGRFSYAMPDVIFDALWNGAADTTDSNIPYGDWADHQRIHQYSGGTRRTYGGHRLNIDRDYLDVLLPAGGMPPAGIPAGNGAAQPGGGPGVARANAGGTTPRASRATLHAASIIPQRSALAERARRTTSHRGGRLRKARGTRHHGRR